MRTKLIAMSAVASIAIAAAGAVVENKVGVVSRIISPPTADEALTVEFGSIFEFAATQQFAWAPEYMLADLATDAVPLATEARQRLSAESPIDANDVQQGVADMLAEIAGKPASEKDAFMLDTVSMPIMTGANYGKFAALRDGVVEPDDVNRVVTTHATAALDGLLRFLTDLPCPDESEESESEESGKRQLDEWADKLNPARGL